MKEQVTGEMLLQRRSELRLSRIDVAKMFGVTERTIINWENGRKIPSSKFDMVADFVSGKGAAGVPSITDMSGFIPIIHADICAGNGNISFNSEKVAEYCYMPRYAGTIGVTIYGDSMIPDYHSGDIAFIREIVDIEDIDFGNAYIVVTRSERVLKLLYPSKTEGCVRAVSSNTELREDGEKRYPDRDIRLEKICYLYKVVGHVRRNQI